jgi:hypothetical protein
MAAGRMSRGTEERGEFEKGPGERPLERHERIGKGKKRSKLKGRLMDEKVAGPILSGIG